MREIEEFGVPRQELTAALIDHSIGYLTPITAERHIQHWERGDTECYCERCYAVYQDDLVKCVQAAAEYWPHLSEERREHLLELVEQISELDDIGQITASMMWPTMG